MENNINQSQPAENPQKDMQTVEPVTAAPSIPPENPLGVTAAKPKKTKYLLFFILSVFIFCIAAVSAYFFPSIFKKNITKDDSPKSRLEAITARGTLIVATDGTYQPMEFKDDQGNLTGYDIDFINKVCEKLGVKPDIRNIAWDNIFTALENNEVDMVVSSVTITDERKAKYLFSDPYLNAGQVIITQKSNNTIATTQDLKNKRIAVQKETTNETEALKYTPDQMVLRYDDFIGATKALTDGKADAIFSDLTNAKGIVAANPNLKIASDPFTNEYYGIVFRKNDTDLQLKVNELINTLRQQGALDFLKQKWLE